MKKYFIAVLSIILFSFTYSQNNTQVPDPQYPYRTIPDVLPGTKHLTAVEDRSVSMLDCAHKLIERKINESIAGRAKYWKHDFSSVAAYERSIEDNRNRFMKIIGLIPDSVSNFNIGFPDRTQDVQMEKISVDNNSDLVGETSAYRIYQVRWPVLNRIHGEGLLLQPKTRILGNIVAIPDADQTPEQLVGLTTGIDAASQFARRFAENGYQVIIPVLISRALLFPGKHEQQTYREWIYRQSFHMGKHIIGFEVQKVMAAIDWFKKMNGDLKIGVAGYSEGGLIAFYSAAVDKRIDAVLVSGYFNSRQNISDEPIYRNVWGLLNEFGDAEITSLIAPRTLIIEHGAVTEHLDQVRLPKNAADPEQGFTFTGYKGKIITPAFKDVSAEFRRTASIIKEGFQTRELVTGDNGTAIHFGSDKSVEKLIRALGNRSTLSTNNEIIKDRRPSFSTDERQLRQVKEMEDHVQWLMRDSDYKRNNYFLHKIMPEFADRTWSNKSYHPYFNSDRFIKAAKTYRTYLAEEVLGRFDEKMLPANARTRKTFDKERWTGYEVVLDVYQDLFATGILLIPKDIKAGEKRPVVVCQHGRNDLPARLVEGNFNYYSDVAAKLADRGFVVYVPQNPYRGEDRYRWLSRKGNAVKKSLFSFIIAQHEQHLNWLATLPFTDKSRIAFYGLSYGGQTAMRVPSILEGYCLSICSGDFGDWTRKVVDTHNPRSFMKTIEWEMPYFDMGNTYSYAEMAYLIFPRPFMVERGHHDMVQPTEWVLYEYGKVKYFYDQFNLGNKTAIEIFNGGHSMRGEGTFRFLHEHLNWP